MKKILAFGILVLVAFAYSGCAHPYWGDVAPVLQQTAVVETPAVATPQPSPLPAPSPSPAIEPSASLVPEVTPTPSPSPTLSPEPSPVPTPEPTPTPVPSSTEPQVIAAPHPSAAPAEPSVTLEGAYVHDPAYDDWYDSDVGLPLDAQNYIDGKILSIREDSKDILQTKWLAPYVNGKIIAYNIDQGLYYKGVIYYLKANSLYKVNMDGTGLRMIREFDQEKFTKEYGWREPCLSYCHAVTQVFIADGYLFYIMDSSKKDVDYAAESLYRMDLSGRNIRLIQRGVHHISHGANGKLYLDVALGHYRELYVGGDGEGAYQGYNYIYDIVAYDIKSGQRSVLVADAEYAESGSYTLWLHDKLYYRSGTWRHSDADKAMYAIDLRTGQKRPYTFLPDQMMPVMRYQQFLFYDTAETGGEQGMDLSTGQTIKIQNCPEYFMMDGQPIFRSETDKYYKLRFQDGAFTLELYTPQ